MTTVTVVRHRLAVTGVVQGVGFRPHVHRLANEFGLGGFVGNDPSGVFVEVEGPAPSVDEFVRRLVDDAPPLAAVASVVASLMPATGSTTFEIIASLAGDGPRTVVPPDAAVCEDCLAEITDPSQRRYRYPFTNCTNCGPRYTVITDLPYDRPATTMVGFALCPACRAEYDDVADRRHHAQPIACPVCGPQLAYRDDAGLTEGTDAVLARFHEVIAAGGIVAVKGIGGYHLACDARSEAAVDRLRERKGRAEKPFAVMVRDLDGARRLARLDPVETEALTSSARPIVLARREHDDGLAHSVAPGNPLLGVLLPYSPLHHLLFAPVPGSATPPPEVLVLTSGNLSDEPICTDDADAAVRLGPLVDGFLVHDRPIAVPCDDSVVRVIDGVVQPVRRSRGYAPVPVELPVSVAPTLAVGAEVKNTFCVAEGSRAWVSAHVGDMGSYETLRAFERSVDDLQRMYRVLPTRVAADLHSGYATRQWAMRSVPADRIVGVQHHHAHVASLMAEHGLDGAEPVIGVVFDGTGAGWAADGSPEIWGGEVLLADYRRFRRLGHLRPLPLPGGDGAVRNPCRVALAYLAAVGIGVDDTAPYRACTAEERSIVVRQARTGTGCTPTTSMGRLFDAVASILDVRHRVGFEAQAAIELEALAETATADVELAFAIDDDGVIDPAPVLRSLIARLADGVSAADLALGFHRAVAEAIVSSVELAVAQVGRRPVLLTGGVFQNAVLARLTRVALADRGIEALTHRVVPPNDGGLALGQAVIAGLARVERS